MSRYIFYYYWSHDLRPCPAKAVEEDGKIIGGQNIIKLGATEYKWEITKEEFFNKNNLRDLVATHPWPDREDK